MTLNTGTIIVVVVLGMGTVQAQVKIDNITIPDSLAKEYFLDCYKNPEPIGYYIVPPTINNFQWFVDNKGKRVSDADINDSTKSMFEWRLVRVRTPNSKDFMSWYLKKKRK